MNKTLVQFRFIFVVCLGLIFLASCESNEKKLFCGVKDAQIDLDVDTTAYKKITEDLLLLAHQYSDTLLDYNKKEFCCFKSINDSIDYFILTAFNEVCRADYWVIHLNESRKQIVKIAENCDTDFSQPEYNWSEYEFMDDTTLISITYKEFIPDTLLTDNGEIPDGNTREKFYGLVFDTNNIKINLLPSGELNFN